MLKMEESFPTFIDWRVEEVVEWLKRLPLANDYSVHFHSELMSAFCSSSSTNGVLTPTNYHPLSVPSVGSLYEHLSCC